MFQFTTYHNPDSFISLEEMVQTIKDHNLELVEQTYSQEWDETTLVLQGTREQFENFFISTTGEESSQSVDIEEFMDLLEEAA